MSDVVLQYALLEEIGRGALGPLHRARDTRSGRTVALRIVETPLAAEPAARARLEQALRRATRLSHPAIATIYDVGEHQGRLVYAQEFVPGSLLSTAMANQPINPRRAVGYAIEIADALAELEAAELRHGHLDGGAVMITPKGRAKLLLDAGFAEGLKSATLSGPSDIAALGVLLTRSIAGDSLSASALPPEVLPIVKRSVDSGYESASLLAAALRGAADSLDARNVDPPTIVPAEPGVPALVKWLAALVLLAGVAAVIWLVMRSN